MGILNLTPDSFYDGGKYNREKAYLHQAEKHVNEGARFLDVGGYSSRPGAKEVSQKEELSRVLPAVKKLTKHFPDIPISIDTFRAEVAKQAVEHGASLVNDISAGNLDENMFATLRALQVPYIMMHMQGTPQTMQKAPTYSDVTAEIITQLSEKVEQLRYLGVNDILIDPGFGFGKTVHHNYQLVKELAHFAVLDCPILVGVSRKSMINKVLGTSPEAALNGTTAVHVLSLLNGANVLRVHDVKEAVQAIQVVEQYKKV